MIGNLLCYMHFNLMNHNSPRSYGVESHIYSIVLVQFTACATPRSKQPAHGLQTYKSGEVVLESRASISMEPGQWVGEV